jgi:hypothetical protein
MNKKVLTSEQTQEIIQILKERFVKNSQRHSELDWANVLNKLEANPSKLWSLNEMELTGGEPDVIAYDKSSNEIIFFDCAIETPKGRRSICYDHEALESRKEFKPQNSAVNMAIELGVEILTEKQYRYLQTLGKFDMKTSSWIKTPDSIRRLGGALFCDRRYETVFTYHNGADSYYGVRGFRACLTV